MGDEPAHIVAQFAFLLPNEASAEIKAEFMRVLCKALREDLQILGCVFKAAKKETNDTIFPFLFLQVKELHEAELEKCAMAASGLVLSRGLLLSGQMWISPRLHNVFCGLSTRIHSCRSVMCFPQV